MILYTLVTIIVSLKPSTPPYISETLIFKSAELCEIALDDIYKDMDYMNTTEFDTVKFIVNISNNKRTLKIKSDNEETKFYSCTEGKIHFNKEKLKNNN